MRLDPDQVVVGDRLRGLSEAKVLALMVSHAETGDLPPIITRPLDLDGDRPTVKLVAGLHRHEACKRLGIKVDCMVRDMTDLEARLVECDENLLAPDLSPYDRAVFIQARLEAWAARFPGRFAASEGETRAKRGRPTNSARFAELSGAPSHMGFAAETAGEVGLSQRTVEAALTIFRGLKPATRAQIAGTWLAKNEGALRQLAAVTNPDEQAAVLQVLLAGKTKSIPDARAIAAGNTPIRANPTTTDDFLKEAKALWKKGGKSQREALLDWLSGQPLPNGWSVGRG
jgi:ParB family chromosome partitioning protein